MKMWVAASPDGKMHVLEHEGDYNKGDTLVMIQKTSGIPSVHITITEPAKE